MEYLIYKDESFPLSFFYDDYSVIKNQLLPCHWHQAFEIVILLSGHLEYIVSGISYFLHPGDCLIINSNKIHSTKNHAAAENTLVFGLVFLPSLFGSSPDSFLYWKYLTPLIQSSYHAIVFDSDSKEGRQIGSYLREIQDLSEKSYNYEIRAFALFLQIWNEILQFLFPDGYSSQTVKLQHEQEVKDILLYIQVNYKESITIKDLMKHVNLSRSECYRSFKRYTGNSPIEYLIDFRLVKAASLLSYSSLNITEITTACGFSTSSYFGKLFKKKYGMSPQQFRKYLKDRHSTPYLITNHLQNGNSLSGK